jgi:DNA-directed RNA polymerase subunit RPC12/RpoP
MFNMKSDPEKYASCPVGPPAWRYKCGGCGAEFEMPSPSGPTEEKSRVCPVCNSRDIKNIECARTAACPPGG